ncbi:type 2C protein phosphatase PTC4 KNAG_0B01350 [Huiozyma naganishii CBS 8797]|uniref:protein-serine/threonine phosphatase n=1 Tax=Huiozyma naganishii (strain ATCC MYA-139 / BCRC 22969 / CBS 8797 / KCTC 17520 / NBRC 10181 / NCYC 3082 / Yp74L-3) TaxID=1071383 RepID=J7RUQ5_HUIN7|nr:hypothetical protein KNAG_0B01350 [Kazachstania naganishii CBS 8797]CCK68582.1 hypothetical protein KNAG_0B01350 [Kazachstania naganishii CBS 8797]
MGQLLSHPLTEKTIEYNDYRDHIGTTYLSHKCPRFFNCVGSMQGYRLTQEDAHMVINEDDTLRIQFYNPFADRREHYLVSVFAVFDGHGGDDCSLFLAGGNGNGYDPQRGIAKWVTRSFETHSYGDAARHKIGSVLQGDAKATRVFASLEGLIAQIMRDAFLKQDAELYRHFANTPCGSTCVLAAVVNGETLYVANCGDSRCVLSSKGNAVKTMSFDHKPQHIGELLRINDNGGSVSLGRVGGVLALSRALGDFQFKRGVDYSQQHASNSHQSQQLWHKRSIPPQEAQVTAEPDVLMHKIDYKRDEFIVLACDGIWDVYSNRQVVKLIKYHLALGAKLDQIVPKLLDHGIAQANSSTGVGFDNMTAMIVVLNKQGETLSDWYTKMKIRLERERGLS